MQNDQPKLYRNLFVAKLNTVTYPCFITWRFHNFITSFSPSLTSENSSICWRLGERIGKETNSSSELHVCCQVVRAYPKFNLHTKIYIENSDSAVKKVRKMSFHVETWDDKLYPNYIQPKLCIPDSSISSLKEKSSHEQWKLVWTQGDWTNFVN